MTTDHFLKSLSPKPQGLVLFWVSCACVILGFAVDNWVLSVVLLSFIVPVFYGTHEALHGTLVPRVGYLSTAHVSHEVLALLVGSALQGMNFRLLRPAHLHHHEYGRYDDGYAPDVIPHAPTFRDRAMYYLNLVGLPPLMWQLAGLLGFVIPIRQLPMAYNIRFDLEQSRIPYFVAQILVVLFFVYAIAVGGVAKFVVFEIFFCFTWSVLQNVAHYGLRGVDPTSDRICAWTYLLPEPFKSLTFGSTAHFMHHANMNVPGSYLYDPSVIAAIESKFGLRVNIKRGVLEFAKDVLRQFRGPMTEVELTTAWLANYYHQTTDKESTGFGYRQGRMWTKTISNTDEVTTQI